MDIIPSTPQVKICTRCRISKPATRAHFAIKPSGLYGLASRCKPCACEVERWRVHSGGRRRHSAPLALKARILRHVLCGLRPGDCWEWLANKNHKGYGQIQYNGKTCKAHRVVYELLVGPIPDGLQLDHTCRNRGCVNPSHLEPVTLAENLKRGRCARRAIHLPRS